MCRKLTIILPLSNIKILYLYLLTKTFTYSSAKLKKNRSVKYKKSKPINPKKKNLTSSTLKKFYFPIEEYFGLNKKSHMGESREASTPLSIYTKNTTKSKENFNKKIGKNEAKLGVPVDDGFKRQTGRF